MVTKIVQKHFLCTFWGFLVTIICDIKIDIKMCERHYVNLFFLWTSSIVYVFDFLTFDIFFDNLTSFWQLDIFLTHEQWGTWPMGYMGNGAHLLDTFKLKPPQPITGLFLWTVYIISQMYLLCTCPVQCLRYKLTFYTSVKYLNIIRMYTAWRHKCPACPQIVTSLISIAFEEYGLIISLVDFLHLLRTIYFIRTAGCGISIRTCCYTKISWLYFNEIWSSAQGFRKALAITFQYRLSWKTVKAKL